MNKETYEALKLLYMNHVKPIKSIDYTREWQMIGAWIDEVAKEYTADKRSKCLNCNPTGALVIQSNCLTCGGVGWL